MCFLTVHSHLAGELGNAVWDLGKSGDFSALRREHRDITISDVRATPAGACYDCVSSLCTLFLVGEPDNFRRHTTLVALMWAELSEGPFQYGIFRALSIAWIVGDLRAG